MPVDTPPVRRRKGGALAQKQWTDVDRVSSQISHLTKVLLKKSKSLYVCTTFKIFLQMYLAVRQPFLMGNRCYMSQISLCPNQPNSISEISHFTWQNAGGAGLPLPWFVCVIVWLWWIQSFLLKHKGHTTQTKLTDRGSGRPCFVR